MRAAKPPVRIARHLAGAAAAALAASGLACRDRATPTSIRGAVPPAAAVTELRLPTPDGSYNVLHPSVRCRDFACFMVACQHTLRDDDRGTRSPIVENTVGYKSAGTDLLRWTPIRNPIMTADEIDSTTDLSDPELLDLGSKLVAYQRLVPLGYDVLYMKESTDTLAWTAPKEVLRTLANAAISPTVLRNGDAYDLWVVDARPQGCLNPGSVTVRRRSTSYADFSGSAVDTTDLDALSVSGMVPWHIEMIEGPKDRPDSLILLVAMHPVGADCSRSSLYIGTTSDGLHFHVNGEPIRAGGGADTIFSMVYRSSGVYFERDRTITILLSGMKFNASPESRLARIKFDYDSLLAATYEGRPPTPLSEEVVAARLPRGGGR